MRSFVFCHLFLNVCISHNANTDDWNHTIEPFSRLIKILRYSKFCLFQRILFICQASSISSLLFVSIAVHFLTKTNSSILQALQEFLMSTLKSTKFTFLNLFKKINFYTIINLLSYNFKCAQEKSLHLHFAQIVI